MTEQLTGHEIAGDENDRHEIAGHEIAGYETITEAANV